MTKRLILMLTAAMCAAQPAHAADAPLLGPDKVLPICDRALVAVIDGKDGMAALAEATKDMPKAQADQVGAVCGVYILGAIALLKHAQEAERARAARASQLTI